MDKNTIKDIFVRIAGEHGYIMDFIEPSESKGTYEVAFYLATDGFTNIHVDTESMDDFTSQYLPVVLKKDGKDTFVEAYLSANGDTAEFYIEELGITMTIRPANENSVINAVTSIIDGVSSH